MVDKLLGLKNYQRKTFKNHFLNQVHCEIRFDGNFTSNVIQLKEDLRSIFKTMEFENHRPIQHGQFAFKIGDQENSPTMENKSSTVGHVFISQKPKREIQVLGDKIVFSDFSYEGFETFSKILLDSITEIAKVIPFNKVNKVGLRKINSMKISPVASFQGACVIFNPTIFNTIRSGLVVEDSLSFNEEKIVLEKDHKLCMMQFRMKKSQEPNAFEANLDFDLVSKTPTNIESVFEEILPKINNEHFDLFMWAITGDLIKLMEG